MRMSKLFASTILATVIGTSAAFAGAVSFTWDPSATSGTALSTPQANPPFPALPTQFTANNITVNDFGWIDATINTADLNDVVERHAFLCKCRSFKLWLLRRDW